jgi:RNA polymerase sigma-70 factor (ECF subfamily)
MTGPASPVLAVDLDRLRPRLHRYCARMVGSVLDGEDIVQDALVRALEASAPERPVDNPEGWLFRIAHNLALDLLRRRARAPAADDDEGIDALADTRDEQARRDAAAASLPAFMRLPPAQRGAVILFDVLDYSAEEVGAILGTTVPAVKSALQRGRGRLRELAGQPAVAVQPALPDAERRLLQRYVDLFNARDFDALREMLAADVRLDLVNRLRLQGPAVGEYFTRYGQAPGWTARAGIVEGRPAVLIRNDGQPDYVAVLAWSGGRLAAIRDFLFARYVMDESCHFTVIER